MEHDTLKSLRTQAADAAPAPVEPLLFVGIDIERAIYAAAFVAACQHVLEDDVDKNTIYVVHRSRQRALAAVRCHREAIKNEP